MPVAVRGQTLRYTIAVAAALAVAVLGFRVQAQLSELGQARSDLADAQHTAADLRRTAGDALGPALIDAAASKPVDVLSRRLAGLGVTVSDARITGSTPAGRELAVMRFVVEGRAGAAAIDRLALWVKANPRSAVLETLSATARADGQSDLKLELDALVHGGGAA